MIITMTIITIIMIMIMINNDKTDVVNALGNLRHLRELSLRNCVTVADRGFVVLNQFFFLTTAREPNWIKYHFCRIAAMTTKCVQLRKLCLTGCRLITDRTLKFIAKNCQRLQVFFAFPLFFFFLSLPFPVDLSILIDKTVFSPRSLSKVLEVAYCQHVSDEGMEILAASCHDLSKLDLEECDHITDRTLIALANNCQKLTVSFFKVFFYLCGCCCCFDDVGHWSVRFLP